MPGSRLLGCIRILLHDDLTVGGLVFRALVYFPALTSISANFCRNQVYGETAQPRQGRVVLPVNNTVSTLVKLVAVPSTAKGPRRGLSRTCPVKSRACAYISPIACENTTFD